MEAILLVIMRIKLHVIESESDTPLNFKLQQKIHSQRHGQIVVGMHDQINIKICVGWHAFYFFAEVFFLARFSLYSRYLCILMELWYLLMQILQG